MATVPEADRLRWYQDMVQLFEKHNIAYANWNYRSGNFGLVNGEGAGAAGAHRCRLPAA